MPDALCRHLTAALGSALACALLLFVLIGGLVYPAPPPVRTLVVFASLVHSAPPARIAPPPMPHFTPAPAIASPPLPAFQIVAPRLTSAAPQTPDRAPPDNHTMPQSAGQALPPDYLAALLAHLAAYKRYPYAARLHHEQGIVQLRFTMDRSGRVLSYAVVRSSGFADLDEAARVMIRDAQPLPPVPPGFPGTILDLVLPLVFSLR